MAEKDLNALFVHQLKDTYFAENAILKALPQMAEAAQSEELKGGGSKRRGNCVPPGQRNCVPGRRP